MTDRSAVARTLWTLVEPLHAVVYFCPEPVVALREAGYRGYWMGYFAGRAAPLGPVGADVVSAVFYNFGADRVARAVPDAWDFAPPATALAAREAGSVAALRGLLGARAEGPDLERAADLLVRAATTAPLPGRPLFAANRALPVPADPLARLWHAATLLREHRGDGHVAVLLAAGVVGREAHVLHALAHGTPRSAYRTARELEDEEWAELAAGLAARGLADADGLTERGTALVEDLEARTDALAATAYAALGDDEVDELVSLLRPLARAVVEGGDLPLDSPMGLDLRTAVAE